MKKGICKTVGCVLAAGIIAALAGCAKKTPATEAKVAAPSTAVATGTLLKSIKDKGELVVGTASGYPPYEFVDITSSSQEVIGIDMALAKAIADELGVKLIISDMAFSALLSSIPAGKIDIAVAGIAPTDERKKTVDFSDVYINAEQKLMIRKADTAKFTKLEDFFGKKIAAEKSTTQEAVASSEITNAQVVALERVPDCILEVLSGKVDGFVVESVVAQQYIIANPSLCLSAASFGKSLKPTAIALAKNNEDLLEVINKVIKDNQSNGNFDKWIQDYSRKAVDNLHK